MKVVKALLLISIVAALIVSVSFAAQQPATGARPGGAGGMGGPGGGGMGGQGGQRMGMMRMSPTRMVIMMEERLNLTEEQVSKLEAIKPADPNAAQKAQQELTDTQRSLTTAVMADDAAKIKELSKKIGDATEKTSLLQAAEYKQIKQILTADQYKQLQQFMSNPMGGRMGGQGGQGGGQTGNRPTRPGGQQ